MPRSNPQPIPNRRAERTGIAWPATRQSTRRSREWCDLVRLILDDGWQPVAASARLRAQVGDPRVLRQMAARVQRTMLERPSQVAERALLTLAEALGEAQPA